MTFEQDVASLTGSYSMGVSPFEEQPCGLRGNGTRIKYATKVLRTLLHAKPNILPISPKNTEKRMVSHVMSLTPLSKSGEQ